MTGLYYFGARYYDPAIGRFITRDPVKGNIMNPQTLNPYVYCVNNPLRYVDPDGNNPRDYIANVDSLYLTWQDMWDASHGDDRSDQWDLDKKPPSHVEQRSDYNLDRESVGCALLGISVFFGIHSVLVAPLELWTGLVEAIGVEATKKLLDRYINKEREKEHPHDYIGPYVYMEGEIKSAEEIMEEMEHEERIKGGEIPI